MIMLYQWDAGGIYTGSVQADPAGALPPRSTPTAPPETTGAQVAQWTGSGWAVLDSRPVPPEPTVAIPESVTMRQARIALSRAGLIPAVEQALATMEGRAGEEARIEWNYSSQVFRYKPFVITLGTGIGLTENQIDELFIAAVGIE